MGWGTKVCSPGLGHMTKMAAIAIYEKKSLKIFSRTKRPMILKLGIQHWCSSSIKFVQIMTLG